MVQLAEKARDYRATYQNVLSSAVRALYGGAIDISQFTGALFTAARKYLTHAWHAGAERAGISPEELTAEEVMTLERAIVNEFGYVAGFATDIVAESQADNGSRHKLLARAGQWASRYDELEQQAFAMASRNEKLAWRLGVLGVGNKAGKGKKKEHCDDCLRLNGIVKRASVWERAGLHPNAYILKCGPGRHCGCRFERTSARATPGPLPSIGKL